jgi:uncharacterized phage-associated protein
VFIDRRKIVKLSQRTVQNHHPSASGYTIPHLGDWKRGPVPAEIYQEIKHGEKMTIGGHLVSLDDYIQINRQESPRRPRQEEVSIEAKGEDNLSMLSAYELELLNRVIKQFGNLNATELIYFLHEEGPLWHKAVQEHKLDTNFELFQNTSNCIIDFSDLIEDDELLKMAAQSAFESPAFHKTLYGTKFSKMPDVFASGNLIRIKDFQFEDGSARDKYLFVLLRNDRGAYVISSLTTSQNKLNVTASRSECYHDSRTSTYYHFPAGEVLGDGNFSFDKETYVFFRENVRKLEVEPHMGHRTKYNPFGVYL